MAQQVQSEERLWTGAFISLTICSLLLFLNLQMLLSSLSTYIKNDIHVGDFGVSLVTSVFALSAVAARFMTAALLTRLPRGPLLAAGLVLTAVSTSIYSLADSLDTLLIMRIAYGIGFGMASTILPTVVSAMIPPRRMGEGIGYYGLASSLAMSIGPMIGMNVMSGFGFGALTAAGTAAILLMFPMLLLSGRAAGASSKPIRPASTPRHDGKRPAFQRKLLLPAALNMLLSVTYSGLLSFIALFGEFVGLTQIGLFFLFNVVTILLVRPAAGKLFDRRGPAAVLVPAALSVAASMIVLSYTSTIGSLIVSALLYGLGFGAIQPTLQAWMLRASGPEGYGAANGMFYNSTDIGIAAGAVLLGLISAATDYAQMYRFSAGFMVLFLILLAGSAWMGRMSAQHSDKRAAKAAEVSNP